MKGPFRRWLVAGGVVLSLLLGALSIEAAAAWARASAPPAAPAITVESLQAQLEAEHVRSAVLLEQLTAIGRQSRQLADGLAAARERIGTDLAAADAMRAELAAAKKQLADLKRQMAAARAASVSASTSGGSAPPPAPAGTAEHEGVDGD
jgi:hypothetical protein